MHIIAIDPFNDAADKHPNDRQAIMDTYRVLRKGTFKNPEELKQVFPSLDMFKYKDKWWIIDIGGNNLRLMAFIQFVNKRVYVKHIVTHAEYDKLCKRYKKGEL
ncbi:MAG: type II toxin-antitoxin system HigB family toxin [Deltaproteobacteria bacterium]|nr:type II toxin-antitoxin system HigB family toxin [Deltaproteobacteria bacterium]